MLKTGQLQEMWVVASQTHLQFNMVTAQAYVVPWLARIYLTVYSVFVALGRSSSWDVVYYLLSWQ